MKVRANEALAWTLVAGRQGLRGIAQVFLQRHAATGACLLTAVAWQSVTLALGCLLGALTGTLFGRWRNAGADADAGLHGYNGALVGIGVLLALPPTELAWGLVVVLSSLATGLAQCWRRHLPGSPYTAPFILMIWLLQAVMPLAGWPPADAVLPAVPLSGLMAVVAGVFRGVGQVMFLDDPWSGALCVLGLALAAPRVAVQALLVSAVASGLAWMGGFPANAVWMGLYGFNAVLVAEAVHQARPGRLGFLCLGVILSLLFMRAFQWLGLPALTAPFVLASWVACCICRADR
ncbi:urea transporter [Castellaniella sp.]|uniref:urea transporter n=1 Tax=Castellaniella sp. TaxID=1955812 RepID=UPI002AFF6611|nr:urea transporter [Castellaniella sp.]